MISFEMFDVHTRRKSRKILLIIIIIGINIINLIKVFRVGAGDFWIENDVIDFD